MIGEALGVIEVVGMAAAIEAADSCVKSANVELIGYELTKGSGLVTIKISGNVGAVKAAIEAAKVSAGKVNKIFATLIIPRPATNLDNLILSDTTVGVGIDKKGTADEIKEEVEEDIKDNPLEEKEQESIEVKVEEMKEVERSTEDNVNISIVEDLNEIEPIELGLEEEDQVDITSNSVNEGNNEVENNCEEEQSKTDETLNNKDSENESDELCNVCHDPLCPRRKGQPRYLCIHYKES